MSQSPPDDLLKLLDSDPIPVADILTRVAEGRKQEITSKFDATLEKLALILAGRKDFPEFFATLDSLVAGHSGDRAWKKHFKDFLLKVFDSDRDTKILIQAVGFDKPLLRPSDCLHQFRTLMHLKPDVLVLDRNLGVGVVRELYPIERKVEADFESRPGHMLAYTFAAETLELIQKSHILAQRHLDRAAFEAKMKAEPGVVLKDALRSFGNKPVVALQNLFVPRITDEKGWKTFWSAARHQVKNDPLVVIPAKRNDPILLLEKVREFDDAWFDTLARERDMARIIESMQDYLANRPGDMELSPKGAGVARERLAFVLKGAKDTQHDLKVRVLILAGELHLPVAEIEGAEPLVASVKDPAKFKEVVTHLQAKDLKRFFEFLYSNDLESTLSLLIDALPEFQYTALCEAISVLREHKREDAVAQALRKPWGTWQAEVDVMYWLASNMDKVAEWKLGSTFDLSSRLLRVIEKEYTGDRLRVANQVRELFRDPKWLARILGDMDARQLRALAQAVRDSTAWQKLDHASVMGQMVKLKPEIEEIISGRSGDSEASNRKLMTSVRSYTTRQQQLQKITLKDIPENTRELALARSYGDLRENFEFQSAKDNQRTLMQRQGELEQMLRKVAPTNFEGCSASTAGMGTSATVRFDDGRTEVFHILGEWDSEPSMNVISCGSALAKAIEGRKAGDRVRVPSSIGEQDATLAEVTLLSTAILEWAAVPIEKLPENSSFESPAPAPAPAAPPAQEPPPASPGQE